MGREKGYIANNYHFYYCHISETRRQFQSKKDFDNYLIRHHKSCECSFIPANEIDYLGKKKRELISIE